MLAAGLLSWVNHQLPILSILMECTGIVKEKLPRGVVKEIMLERILLVTNFSGIERDVVSCLYESDVILFSIS